MKALTIQQPHAHFIAAGAQDVENRSWKTKYRGRIFIHAGATENVAAYKKLTDSQRYEAQHCQADKAYFSAIIGTVEIVDCVKNHPSVWAEKGKWQWVLANPMMFKEPIQDVRGQLGLWEYKGQLPSLDNIRESAFYNICKSNARAMVQELTQVERMQVSFIPCVITQLAWHYAYQAMECAKNERVEDVKKLCRCLKVIYEDYIRDIKQFLSFDCIKQIEDTSNEILQDLSMDMLKFYFAVNNEFKRVYPNEKYDRMRSYALMGELLIELLVDHNKDMNKFLLSKFENPNLEAQKIHRNTEALRTGLVEFSTVGKEFNFENQSIQIGLSVIKKKLQEMKSV